MAIIAATALSTSALAETKTMTLDDFSQIKTYTSVDFDISVGQKQSITVAGRAEDLAKIIMVVKRGILIVEKEKNSGHMKKVNVTLTVKNLSKFEVHGSSDAIIRDVDSKSFEIDIKGSGDVRFRGKSDELAVKISGSGDVASGGFDAGKVSAKINGSGDIALAGKCKKLELSISGSGDFAGAHLTCADVEAQISGSGDADLYASTSVRVKTSGSSDVNVYGQPKSIQNSSSGSTNFTVHVGK